MDGAFEAGGVRGSLFTFECERGQAMVISYRAKMGICADIAYRFLGQEMKGFFGVTDNE